MFTVQRVRIRRCQLVFAHVSFLLPHLTMPKATEQFRICYTRIFPLVELNGHKRKCSFRDDYSIGDGSLLWKGSIEANRRNESAQEFS